MWILFIFWLPLLLIVPVWKIFTRAGFEPRMSLLLFVPFIGWVIVLWYLAMNDWPSMKTATKET